MVYIERISTGATLTLTFPVGGTPRPLWNLTDFSWKCSCSPQRVTPQTWDDGVAVGDEDYVAGLRTLEYEFELIWDSQDTGHGAAWTNFKNGIPGTLTLTNEFGLVEACTVVLTDIGRPMPVGDVIKAKLKAEIYDSSTVAETGL